MSEIFNDKTTAEIDAKLHRDILKHNLNIEKISIGLVILLMILFRGWIFYWLKFVLPFRQILAINQFLFYKNRLWRLILRPCSEESHLNTTL